MNMTRHAAWALPTVALLNLLSACGSGSSSDGRPTETDKAARPKESAVGKNLAEALQQTIDSDLGYAVKDATNPGRYAEQRNAKQYTVRFEKDVPKFGAIDLYVVPVEETCPKELGAKVTPPKVPDVTGKSVLVAFTDMVSTGFPPERIAVFKESDPAKPTNPEPVKNWSVCKQTPTSVAAFNSSTEVKLHAAKECP